MEEVSERRKDMIARARKVAGEQKDERTRLADRLRQAREYVGLSQDDVARHLGVPRTALSNMETGQRKVEALELKQLAKLYRKPVSYFTSGYSEHDALPEDVAHLARAAASLSAKDREELERFAEYLKSRERPETAKK